MKKTQNGITLIALIITIIVMLILVAVTLVITLGENGIIAKAREASQKSNARQEAEKLELGANAGEKINGLVEDGTPWNLNTSGEKPDFEYYTYHYVEGNNEGHMLLIVPGKGTGALFTLYCEEIEDGESSGVLAENIYDEGKYINTGSSWNGDFLTNLPEEAIITTYRCSFTHLGQYGEDFYASPFKLTKGGEIYFDIDNIEITN